MRDDDFESSTTSRHSNAVAFEHPFYYLTGYTSRCGSGPISSYPSRYFLPFNPISRRHKSLSEARHRRGQTLVTDYAVLADHDHSLLLQCQNELLLFHCYPYTGYDEFAEKRETSSCKPCGTLPSVVRRVEDLRV